MNADKKYMPTGDTTNFVRLVAFLADICADVFRDVFDSRVPPVSLSTVLSANKSKLLGLKVLNYEQKQFLYPPPGGTPCAGSSKDMDLSLLYILLRSICNITSHSSGWGKPPATGDTCLSANIERIRIERNKIQGHVKRAAINDAEFENHWKCLSDAVTSIETSCLGGGTKYKDSITMLYSTSFDPEMEKIYRDEFKKSHDKEVQNRELIEKVHGQLLSTDMQMVTIGTRLSGVQVDVNKMRHEQGSIIRTNRSLVDAQKKTDRQMKFANRRLTELKDDLTKEGQKMFENTHKTVMAAMSDIKSQMEDKTQLLSDMEKLLARMTSTTDESLNNGVKDDICEMKNHLSNLRVDISSLEKLYSDISVQLHQIQGNSECTEDQELKRIIEYSKEEINQYNEQKSIVQTEAMRYLMNRLDDSEQCAIITGYVGQGKSTLAKEGVSKLSKESSGRIARVPVIISRPDQWHIVVRSKKPMIVCIDDIFGKTNFDQSMMTLWSPLLHDMQTAIASGKVVLIMTMRKHIFDDAKINLLEYKLFQEKNVVDLTSENLQLTDLERKNILYAHIKCPESKAALSKDENKESIGMNESDDEKIPISVSVVEEIITKSTKLSQDLGYPQCCRMFVSDKTYLKQGVLFFENPVEFLRSHLDKMYSRDKMSYFTLCYTLFSDNQMYLEDMHVMPEKTQNNGRFHDIALVCGIPQSSIWDVLISVPEKVKAMHGSFLTFNKMEGFYALSHRSVSDALCWSFGKLSSRKLVEHCPLTFLCENVRTRYCPRGSEKMVLEIVPRYYCDLAMRITNEILNGNIMEVAKHVILQDAEFVKVLLEYWKDTGSFSNVLSQKISTFNCDTSFFSLVALLPGGELMKQIVRSGELEKLRDKSWSEKIKADALHEVCSVRGDFEMYSILISSLAPVSSNCLLEASSADFFEIVIDLLCRFEWRPEDLCKARMFAILKGNFRSYKSLVDYDLDSLCFEDIITAVETESEFCVSHLLQTKTWDPKTLSSALEKACQKGNFKIFNLLLQSDAPFTEDCLGYAAEHKDGKILSTLLKNKNWSEKEIGVALARAICKVDCKESQSHEYLLQSVSLSRNALGECLFEIVQLQNTVEAETLIEKYPDSMKYVNNKCETLLHHSMLYDGLEDFVELLLDKGLDVHLRNVTGRTALHYAATFGQTSKADILINRGAAVNVKDENGMTPLHCSAKGNNYDVAKLLLERDADINAENKWQMTALYYLADHSRNLDFAVLLASKGAKLHDCDFISSTWSSDMLLCHCLEMCDLEILRDFLENGDLEKQDINIALLKICQQGLGNFEMYKCLFDYHAVPSAGCLMEAVFHNDDICLDLIERKSDWSEKELSKSLNYACRNGNTQIYHKLLISGAVVDIDCMIEATSHIDIFTDILTRQTWSDYQLGMIMADPDLPDEHREKIFESIMETASSISSVVGECLCEAVKMSNITTAEEMIMKYDADVNFMNGANSSPLHIAAGNADTEVVEYLLGKGANTQTKDGCGRTPFLIACGTKYIENVKILHKHSSCEKEMQDDSGKNGLHHAAISGSEHVISFLLLNGFDISSRDLKGQTPIYLASEEGNLANCKILLKNASDITVNAVDKQGQSSLHIAMDRGYANIAICLLQQGACLELKNSRGETAFQHASVNVQEQVTESFVYDVKMCHEESMEKLCFLADSGYVEIIRSVLTDKKSPISVLQECMGNSLCSTMPISCYLNNQQEDVSERMNESFICSNTDSPNQESILSLMPFTEHEYESTWMKNKKPENVNVCSGIETMNESFNCSYIDSSNQESILSLTSFTEQEHDNTWMKNKKPENVNVCSGSETMNESFNCSFVDSRSQESILSLMSFSEKEHENTWMKNRKQEKVNFYPGNDSLHQSYRNCNVEKENEANNMGESFSFKYSMYATQPSWNQSLRAPGRIRLTSAGHKICIDEQNGELNKGMLHACKTGNYDFYDVLLDLGAMIPDGCLQLAIKSNCEDIIKDLLIQRQDWNSLDLDSAKLYIIQTGNVKMFSRLVEYSINIDYDCLLHSLDNIEILKMILHLKEWSSQEIVFAFARSWPSKSPTLSFEFLLGEVRKRDLLQESLFESVKVGSEHIVMKMIELNLVDLTWRNMEGYLALHIALLNGHENVLNILLDNGATLNVQYKETPLLHWALTNCSLQMFKYIVHKGAPLDVRNGDGCTILLTASGSNRPEAVKTLLEAHVPIDEQDDQGRMSIHYASLAEDMVTVDILLENGAMIDDRDYDDCTPLHLVTKQGFTNTIEAVSSRGAFIDDQDGWGRTALHTAVDNNHTSSVLKLLELGACVDGIDHEGKNALHIAVINNSIEISEILLQNKVDLNQKDWNKRVPLHYAVLGGNYQMVELLVKYGFERNPFMVDQENINCQDEKKWTPLHYAVDNGDIKIMKILLDNGALVDVKDDLGRRPLHIASKFSNICFAEALLNSGAILDVRNNDNDTPLHVAVQSNNTNYVSLLLYQGANISVVNKNGLSPLDIAKRGKEGMYNLFKKHLYVKDVSNGYRNNNECRVM